MEKQKNGIGALLGWIFGVIFIMIGISEIRGEIFLGITTLLLGVYLLPPATQQLEKRANINLKGWRKLAGFMGGFVFMAVVAAIFDTSEPAPTVIEPVKNVKVTETIATKTAKTEAPDEVEPAEIKEDEQKLEEVIEVKEEEPDPIVIDAELIEQLQREIDSINEGVSFDNFYDNVLGIQMGVGLFGTWAIIIENGEKSENPEANQLAKTLRQKVSQTQIAQFPKLRKAYGAIVKQQVWEHNVEVDVFGNANGTIQFTSYIFADNGNKKMIQEIAGDMLRLLRFDQSRYKWYKGDDEYTYFTLNSELDSKVMVIK